MKTLTGVLCFLVFGVFGVAYAGSEVKIEGGKILVSPSVWTATGVKVSKEAEKYPNAVLEAFRSPGKVITVEEKVSQTIVGLFHYREDITATLGVRYNAAEAMVDVERMDERLGEKDSFSPYPIVWLIAVAAFFVFRKIKKGIAFVVFAIFPTLGVALAAASFATAASLAAAPLALIAAFVTAAFDGADDMISKIFSTLFYMLMIISAGSLYYPLFF